MSVIGKMVTCVIGSFDGSDKQVLYADYDELKKGGEYAHLEELAEQYMLACLSIFRVPPKMERAEFVAELWNTLWGHITGEAPFTDVRKGFPIVDDIKAEWDKLDESQQWQFLD